VQTQPGHLPGIEPSTALPLAPGKVALLARFTLSDAGAVWFREMVEGSLRLLAVRVGVAGPD